jgi:3-hydroxyacyl-CoA dehydrogenase
VWIETVAVLGASEAGTSCAVASALAGCAVRVCDDAAALEGGLAGLRRTVELALAAGALTPSERQRILDGVIFTPDLDEAVTGADLVVHAAPAAPPGGWARAAKLLRATAPIAAAGPRRADAIAAAVPQPGRVVELRVAAASGQVPRLELVRRPGSSPHAHDRTAAFAARVNQAARAAP